MYRTCSIIFFMDIEDVNWSGEFDGETFELSVNDSYVVGCHWRCKNNEKPKYVLLFMHGLANCVSFNCNFLREIPNHNGSTLATDHKGSGKSPGVNSYTTIDEICEEIKQLIIYAKMLYKDVPIFLMGHSLGGLSALTFCMGHYTELNLLKGVIVHAPWLDTKGLNITPLFRSIIKLASKFLPTLQLPTGLKIENSCYPDEYKKMALESGYAIMTMTPYLFNSVLNSMDFVLNNPDKFPKQFPMLFIQGTDDGCVKVEKNLKWAETITNLCGKEYIDTKIIENGPHDTTKYKTRREALETLFDFINKRISE